jgi:hypothetical protein
MVDVVISKYELDDETSKDVIQNVLYKIFRRFKTHTNLEKYFVNPSVFLFSYFSRYIQAEIYHLLGELRGRDFIEDLDEASLGQAMDPEKIYLVKEQIDDLIARCKEKASFRLALSNSSRQRKSLIHQILERIYQELGGLE